MELLFILVVILFAILFMGILVAFKMTNPSTTEMLIQPFANQKISNREKDPLVLIYQTDPENENHRNLIETLKKWKWELVVIGFGDEWFGFGTKTKGILNWLKTTSYHDDQVVIISDSNDVLANDLPTHFMTNYLTLANGDKIVFSSERGCCVQSMSTVAPGGFIASDGKRMNAAVPGQDNQQQVLWKERMIKIKEERGFSEDPNGYNFLNAGMMVGKMRHLRKMIEYVQADFSEDDQSLFTEYFLRFPEEIVIDYGNKLFSNAHGWSGWSTLDGCNYTWNANKQQFILTHTGTVPSFIQTPGKYFYCYKELQKCIDGKDGKLCPKKL
jgi:hypothetical protein